MSSGDLSRYVALAVNAKGEITGWNQGCTALFGLTAEAALGRQWPH
jgi:hypothetical protein